MAGLQEQFDEAMFAFSRGEYDEAIAGLKRILEDSPDHYDAQLALGMAFFRKGDYATAIVEGRKAEQLKPNDQLAHTNLSLFYMKAGDRPAAEHHGLHARLASWKQAAQAGQTSPPADDPELRLARPKLDPVKLPSKFPDMPWKKKPPVPNPTPKLPNS